MVGHEFEVIEVQHLNWNETTLWIAWFTLAMKQ